jgi:manganese/zinc/iron transport system ATP- binding protein
MIKIKELTVAYNSDLVLDDVSLDFPDGKLIGVIGPNGGGKTTLLKSIIGLIKPIKGEISFPDNFKKGSIAYVPQSASIDWNFPTTVFDVALMGRYGHIGPFKRPRKIDRQIAGENLEKVGMSGFFNRQISELSGGQRQRVFLARALAQEADFYLLDEPFKGVDISSEKTIVGILKNLKQQEKTALIVHHNLDTVKEYFDWIAFINVVAIAEGNVESTFTRENIELAYKNASFDRIPINI